MAYSTGKKVGERDRPGKENQYYGQHTTLEGEDAVMVDAVYGVEHCLCVCLVWVFFAFCLTDTRAFFEFHSGPGGCPYSVLVWLGFALIPTGLLPPTANWNREGGNDKKIAVGYKSILLLAFK